MSVDNPDVVDAVGQDIETGEIVLTVSDHLDWEDVRGHAELLVEKLDMYLNYVTSGQVFETHGKLGDSVRIDVIGKHEMPESIKPVIQQITDQLGAQRIAFRAYRLPDGY